MTDEQIASIAQYWRNFAEEARQRKDPRRAVIETAKEDITALLAEVERLRVGFEEVIALIQEARNVSRPEHFSETADNILIRAINAARVAQQGD